MLYLAIQTLALLLVTAGSFFALGYAFHQRFSRAPIVVNDKPPAEPPPPPKRAAQDFEERIGTLEHRMEDLFHKVDPDFTGPDNLEGIKGIGPFIRKMLEKEFGIRTFEQIARLSNQDIDKISVKLFFKNKIQREGWIDQARALHFKKYGKQAEIESPSYPLKPAA